MIEFFESQTFGLIIMPLLIFALRVLDVSLETLRIIFISRGMKLISSFIGFVELMIWLIAISQIMSHLNNFSYYVAYALGFAFGTYVGIAIEDKIAMGLDLLMIITSKDVSKLVAFLNSVNYGITIMDGQGTTGKVKIIYTVVRRKDVSEIVSLIKKFNPDAFYSIQDVRSVSPKAIFPRASLRHFKIGK
ncbi:MAG: DUF2179 domain-containing protein [Candidatus Woesearchaeota archaeon]